MVVFEGSFADENVTDPKELKEMAIRWVDIESDEVVVEAEMDEMIIALNTESVLAEIDNEEDSNDEADGMHDVELMDEG